MPTVDMSKIPLFFDSTALCLENAPPSHVSHHKCGRQALHLAGRQPGTDLEPTNTPYMGHERGIGLFAFDASSGRIYRIYGFMILSMPVEIEREKSISTVFRATPERVVMEQLPRTN